MIIVCPKCMRRLRVQQEAVGRVLSCPQCNQPIDTSVPTPPIEPPTATPSSWFYRKAGWFTDEEIGPVSDDTFLSLVSRRQIKKMTLVRSPEVTNNQWQNFCNIAIGKLEAAQRIRREAERQAELDRLNRKNIKQENLDRLRLVVQEAIADGQITESEKKMIGEFAEAAELSRSEVQRILTTEGKRLIDEIVAEALSDGVLTPDEEARIQAFSTGIGIPLEHDERTLDLIELSRLCWLFDSCDLDEFPTLDVSFRLQANEVCFASHRVEWNGVRPSTSSRRTVSSPLTPIGIGNVFVTSKRLLFMTDVESKSIRHTSVGRIEGHVDGILLVRTTGRSVFLKFTDGSSLENQKLVLLLQRVCLEKPGALRASFPSTSFASRFTHRPEQVVIAEVVHDRCDQGLEPRFTFRVVGTSYGNRQRFVNALTSSDTLQIVREPDNPADSNAVAILDRRGNQLGYLKREVAAWFSPKLDRGDVYRADVYRIRDDGALIVGVYEL